MRSTIHKGPNTIEELLEPDGKNEQLIRAKPHHMTTTHSKASHLAVSPLAVKASSLGWGDVNSSMGKHGPTWPYLLQLLHANMVNMHVIVSTGQEDRGVWKGSQTRQLIGWYNRCWMVLDWCWMQILGHTQRPLTAAGSFASWRGQGWPRIKQNTETERNWNAVLYKFKWNDPKLFLYMLPHIGLLQQSEAAPPPHQA